VVPWEAIKKIGEDIILVECEFQRAARKREKRSWFWEE